MKCPYAVDRHCVTQTRFEYDEEGVEIFRETIEHNTAEFVDCLRNACGAWKGGCCAYCGNN